MGNRGPAPTPTVIRKAEGNPGKRPFNDREPQPRAIRPKMPKHLDPPAKKEWKRLCPMLERLHVLTEADGIAFARGGTYLCMEGPQFSSLAESMTYKEAGYSVIGMTNMPEAKLAREAEICYATVAMVTDFDCWHPDHDAVTVQDIIRVLNSNADKAKSLVARLARDFPREHEPCPIGCDRALDTAVITAPEARDPDLLKKLDAVAGRILRA